MKHDYDLLVIGSGVAGHAPAVKCAKAGWRVGIAESGSVGGTCSLTGCNPKKVLVQAAETVERTRMIGKQALSGSVRIDWPRLIAFKRSFTDPIPPAREHAFKEAGITILQGRAGFADTNSVVVGDAKIGAGHIVVATGAKPRDLKIEGRTLITTSDRFMETEVLPKDVTFMGGGYISMEFSRVAAAAGARVTVLEMGSRPLAGFDEDLVDLLTEGLRASGITFRMNSEVASVKREHDHLVVHCRSDKGEFRLQTGMVVHGAGRVPDLDGLALDRGKVEYGARGIKVNEFLQSVSNSAVYACGDCADSGLMLSPVAEMEGAVVAHNLGNGNRLTADHAGTPSVVFTNPSLASVGLREGDARDRNFSFEVKFENTSSWSSSRRIGNKTAGFKTLVENKTGRLLGAHILGPHAEEVINVFALAMRYGLTAGQLKRAIWAFPTSCADIEDMV